MSDNVAVYARLPILTLVVFVLSSCGDPPSQSSTIPTPIAPSVATTDQPPPTPTVPPSKREGNPDTDLAFSVKKTLEADKDVADQGIDVTASRGTVTLWGTVGTKEERERASSVAARVPGVVSVENRLVVVKGS